MSGIAACLYVRNAEHDIKEWIAYHYVIGIGTFLIYDNGSNDNTVAKAQELSLLIDIRVVPWGHATGPEAQSEAYENCFQRFQQEFEWILVIDSDEYLSNTEGSQIESLTSKHFFSAGIAFNWACFGSNGHTETPPELTIKAFIRRSDETFGANNHTKLLVRPRLVKNIVNPHYFDVDGPIKRPDGTSIKWQIKGVTESPNLSDWYINHYFVRSRAQWEAKLARGYRDCTTRETNLFHIYDRNEVLDQTAAARTDAVLALIEQAKNSSVHGNAVRKSWLARVSSLMWRRQLPV